MTASATTTRYEVSTPTGTYYTDTRANALAHAARNGGSPKAKITAIVETRERLASPPSPTAKKRPAKAKPNPTRRIAQ